jgi:hypothetical protein
MVSPPSALFAWGMPKKYNKKSNRYGNNNGRRLVKGKKRQRNALHFARSRHEGIRKGFFYYLQNNHYINGVNLRHL